MKKTEFAKALATVKRKQVVLMSREEAGAYLKISLPTLHKWTNEGVLKAYRLGGRVYYKQHEILKALMQINS